MIKNGVMEYSNGQQATLTKETTKQILETDMARCTGPMAVITKVIGLMEYKMAKVMFSSFRIILRSQLRI